MTTVLTMEHITGDIKIDKVQRRGRKGMRESVLIDVCKDCGMMLMLQDRVNDTLDFLCPRCGEHTTVEKIPEVQVPVIDGIKEDEEDDVKDLPTIESLLA